MICVKAYEENLLKFCSFVCVTLCNMASLFERKTAFSRFLKQIHSEVCECLMKRKSFGLRLLKCFSHCAGGEIQQSRLQ